MNQHAGLDISCYQPMASRYGNCLTWAGRWQVSM